MWTPTISGWDLCLKCHIKTEISQSRSRGRSPDCHYQGHERQNPGWNRGMSLLRLVVLVMVLMIIVIVIVTIMLIYQLHMISVRSGILELSVCRTSQQRRWW